MSSVPQDQLVLEPVSGPSFAATTVEPDAPMILGRGSEADIILFDETVSRRHAMISRRRQTWLLSDLGSRHGTFLNGVTLTANTPTVIANGDLIGIHPWVLKVRIGSQSAEFTHTVDDTYSQTCLIERVTPDQTAALAQQRLDLLIDCAAAINSATDEQQLGEAVLDSALAGSGFERAALLRQHGSENEIELLTARNSDQKDAREGFVFSRSLLRVASQGELARLTDRNVGADYGMSVVEKGVTAALCSPILLGPSIAAYLYLDAVSAGKRVADDAATFCQVIARLCGLAYANLKRQDLERRTRLLESEMNAARNAQLMILPKPHGAVGPIEYAVEVRPGRFVAGDLFDVIPLDADRTAVFLGDVAGHGVGAGVIMAAAQAHLQADLKHGGQPAEVVSSLNRYLTHHTAPTSFLSLWLGIFDRAQGTVQFLDAGHGYWMIHAGGDDQPRRYELGEIPVGIDPDIEYQTETLAFGPDERLLVFSDGVVEQTLPDGSRIGLQRVLDLFRGSIDCHDEVRTVFNLIEQLSGRTSFDDDTTVASIRWN
ncbi:MAG: FHA domain-containing protein [Phycisphaerales bacterium]|nr:MAG: FHA domain-containing protein [Phycisphaerales bacterium]